MKEVKTVVRGSGESKITLIRTPIKAKKVEYRDEAKAIFNFFYNYSTVGVMNELAKIFRQHYPSCPEEKTQ